MPVRLHLTVHGRVQAVGYRAFVARAARSRGVAGWVRNRDDGAVEAVLEGEPELVESLARVCREGPRGARVDDVAVRNEPPEGLQGFEVH